LAGIYTYTITAVGICDDATATGKIIVICPATAQDTVNHYTYEVVELAGHCWFKENLLATKYQDGTSIPFANPYFHSLYPNSDENTEFFGLLYTWYSAMGMVGTGSGLPLPAICPKGWRLPTSAEWALLNVYDANYLRTPDYWLQPNANTNDSDFNARGAGYYNSATQRFEKLYGYTAYWSSDDTEGNSTATCCRLNYYCNQAEIAELKKEDAVSVRCVKE
jgi:uncharacterized protein (TIGR02145 family)